MTQATTEYGNSRELQNQQIMIDEIKSFAEIKKRHSHQVTIAIRRLGEVVDHANQGVCGRGTWYGTVFS